MNNLFESNWKSFPNINNLHEEKFDLIYGSHSLEHINNLDSFNKKIKTLSTNNTLFFWEVPNADHQYSGIKENRIGIIKYFALKKLDIIARLISKIKKKIFTLIFLNSKEKYLVAIEATIKN